MISYKTIIMSKLSLTQNQYSDFLNLTNNVFYPLKNFVTQNEFELIINKSQYKKKFYPFPIFFGVNKNNFNKIMYSNKIDFYYKKKIIAKVTKPIFFDINKKKFGKKIYGKNYTLHPFFKKFELENFKFLSFKILKLYKLKIEKKIFISPKDFLNSIDRNKIKKISAFHTRNVPHKAHQWIHKFLLKDADMLLIQPLIGQYKKGEYKDDIIIKSNKIIAKIYKKKTLVIPFFSYPRYGGPKEAALHAIVRRNYGCTKFWVGRDHAGIGKFFSKYASQQFTNDNQKKIGITIISEKEPYYCKNHSIILNNCNCKTNQKILISGSKIRNLISKNKRINHLLMNPLVSKLLDKNSII
mgnify:FL=1